MALNLKDYVLLICLLPWGCCLFGSMICNDYVITAGVTGNLGALRVVEGAVQCAISNDGDAECQYSVGGMTSTSISGSVGVTASFYPNMSDIKNSEDVFYHMGGSYANAIGVGIDFNFQIMVNLWGLRRLRSLDMEQKFILE